MIIPLVLEQAKDAPFPWKTHPLRYFLLELELGPRMIAGIRHPGVIEP